MQNHTKNYMDFFGFKIAEDCSCEICGSQCNDVHHIIPRSKFGSKTKDKQDSIENLIGLCRLHHEDAHKEILSKETLTNVHLAYMKTNGKNI